jgi:hypothetical protein
MTQLHKKFTDAQVKELFARYCKGEIPRRYMQEVLGIKKRRFFALVKQYRENPDAFSIRYRRQEPTRRIQEQTEKAILKELAIEKRIIDDKENPVRRYNYSYIKDLLTQDYKQAVSLSTIISRAKRHGFYIKRTRQVTHDREVLTNYAGELVQHDASFHLWAPAAEEKWYLITSLDDYSRFLLYAELLRRESSWAHILALQTVFLKYGFPFSYYVDSHSIFRFVQGRDSIWRDHHKLTDEVDPQWKQVLQDCGVKLLYALSPRPRARSSGPTNGSRTAWSEPASATTPSTSAGPGLFCDRKSTATTIGKCTPPPSRSPIADSSGLFGKRSPSSASSTSDRLSNPSRISSASERIVWPTPIAASRSITCS